MTEKEKMLAGELYNATDVELTLLRKDARILMKIINNGFAEDLIVKDAFAKLFAKYDYSDWIEPPFFCDYGFNISLGSKVFINFNCTMLDVNKITIGNNVLIGPNVQFYSATHPLDFQLRREELELGLPIEIGDDVWIGGGTIICPGVKIGNRCVIGAGSVVTKDIPDGVLAVGNPCKVIKQLE